MLMPIREDHKTISRSLTAFYMMGIYLKFYWKIPNNKIIYFTIFYKL